MNGNLIKDFRNSKDLEGLYIIEDEVFFLQYDCSSNYDIKKNVYYDKDGERIVEYAFCGEDIMEEVYNWLSENESYFKGGEVYIYDWIYEGNLKKFKKIKEVELD